MIIGVGKRFVFIANSKAASTTIEELLAPHATHRPTGAPALKHMSWIRARRDYAFVFDDPAHPESAFFRFGVIREPADWVLSWYNYRSFRPRSGISRGYTFDDFWAKPDWIKRKDQSTRFTDADGVCRFDLLIPYQHLGEALPRVMEILGIECGPERRLNRSKGTLRREEVEPRLWEEINAYYAADFDCWRHWSQRFGEVLGTLRT
jgi:hypothetical protein